MGGRAISRVLFARRNGQMVISLGWLSPATSRGLPAAQAARAVLRHASAGARPAWLLGREPEPVAFLENQPPDSRPVACPKRRRSQGDGVYHVETARALEREQIARPDLRGEQQQRPVW